MNLTRYFNEDLIKLDMTTVIEPPGETESVDKWRQKSKELVLDELVSLLERSENVCNRTKLLNDFIYRERKATTAIGHGIAIPHIRSMQAREFTIAFARSKVGYDFDSLDKEPSHLFFVMASPPYDDNFYLKVFKNLSENLRYESVREELMNIESEGELIRVLRSME